MVHFNTNYPTYHLCYSVNLNCVPKGSISNFTPKLHLIPFDQLRDPNSMSLICLSYSKRYKVIRNEYKIINFKLCIDIDLFNFIIFLGKGLLW